MGVTGIRQSDVLKRLAGNTDLVTQALQVSNDGWRQNTALTNEVANRNDSMRIGSADVEDAALRLAEDASIDPEATTRPTRQGGWYGYGGSKDTGLPTYGNTYYYSIVVDGRTVSSSRRLEGAVRELAALAASGSDY